MYAGGSPVPAARPGRVDLAAGATGAVPLLVPEGFHGVHAGRAEGRVKSEDHAHEG